MITHQSQLEKPLKWDELSWQQVIKHGSTKPNRFCKNLEKKGFWILLTGTIPLSCQAWEVNSEGCAVPLPAQGWCNCYSYNLKLSDNTGLYLLVKDRKIFHFLRPELSVGNGAFRAPDFPALGEAGSGERKVVGWTQKFEVQCSVQLWSWDHGKSEHQLQDLLSKVLCASVILPALPHCLKGASLASTALTSPISIPRSQSGSQGWNKFRKELSETQKSKGLGAWALSLSCNGFNCQQHIFGIKALQYWDAELTPSLLRRFQWNDCSPNNPSGIASWKVGRGRSRLLQEATKHRPARCWIIHTVSWVKISQVDDPKEVPQMQLFRTSYSYSSPRKLSQANSEKY